MSQYFAVKQKKDTKPIFEKMFAIPLTGLGLALGLFTISSEIHEIFYTSCNGAESKIL